MRCGAYRLPGAEFYNNTSPARQRFAKKDRIC